MCLYGRMCVGCVFVWTHIYFFLSHFNDDQKSLAEGSSRDLHDLQSNFKFKCKNFPHLSLHDPPNLMFFPFIFVLCMRLEIILGSSPQSFQP